MPMMPRMLSDAFVLEIGAGVVVVRVFLFLFPMEEEVDEVVGVFGEMVGEVGRWWVDFVR